LPAVRIDPPESLPRHLALLSLFFPVYYMAASWLVTLRLWRKQRRVRAEAVGSLSS